MGDFTEGDAGTMDIQIPLAWDSFIFVSESLLRPYGKELEAPILLSEWDSKNDG